SCSILFLATLPLKNTGESRSNTVCSKAKIIQARSRDLYLSKRFYEKILMRYLAYICLGW
ncbi:unnamed protein product, partial [Brassica rapa subsp. trilocularis]